MNLQQNKEVVNVRKLRNLCADLYRRANANIDRCCK